MSERGVILASISLSSKVMVQWRAATPQSPAPRPQGLESSLQSSPREVRGWSILPRGRAKGLTQDGHVRRQKAEPLKAWFVLGVSWPFLGCFSVLAVGVLSVVRDHTRGLPRFPACDHGRSSQPLAFVAGGTFGERAKNPVSLYPRALHPSLTRDPRDCLRGLGVLR